jgi:hypothetical protein
VFGLSVNFLNVGSQPCRPRSASFSFASSPSSSVHVLLEVTNHRPAESVDISLGYPSKYLSCASDHISRVMCGRVRKADFVVDNVSCTKSTIKTLSR